MDHPTPPSVTPTIEEKLAKLCVRPHLSSDVLPRFVLTMLECALHSFLCSFAACVMEIIEKYRRGELEPWPDEAQDEQPMARQSTYQRKSPPQASTCRAGAKHAPITVQTAAEEDAGDLQQAVLRRSARLMPCPALPQTAWGGLLAPPLQPLGGTRIRSPDRCRSAPIFSAAGMRRETRVQIVPVS